MNEYELYTRILSPHMRPNDQTLLIEKKLKKSHKADIVADGVDSYSLYRYDMDADPDRFLPFFNKSHHGELGKVQYPTPHELLMFCDYILLVSKSNKLFVILVEMKSGNDDNARKQLDATETFMDYVRQSAERIKFQNDYRTFSSDNIKLRKVILTIAPSIRPTTNVGRKRNSKIDFDADVVKIPSSTLPLNKLCQR